MSFFPVLRSSVVPAVLCLALSSVAQARTGGGCEPARIDSVITNAPVCAGEPVNLALLMSGDVFGYSWEGPGTGTFFSTEPFFSFPGQFLGQYTIVAFGLCGNDTAYAAVTAQGAGAGRDSSITLCSDAQPVQLGNLLGLHDEGGIWTCNGESHTGCYVPGTDIPGDYIYTAPNPATCSGTAQTATISVAELHMGQSASVEVCAGDSAFDLAQHLDPDLAPGGQWGQWVFISLVPHSGIYDPAVDSSATFRYSVEGCHVQVMVEEWPLLQWFADQDGDGYGDPDTSVWSCGPVPGHVRDSTDTCAHLPGRIGDPCDDGFVPTVNDRITDDCICAGVIPVQVAEAVPMDAGRLWPNPIAGGTLNIASMWNGQAVLELVDAAGRVQWRHALRLQNGLGAVELPEGVAPGLYLVRLGNEQHQAVHRLLVR